MRAKGYNSTGNIRIIKVYIMNILDTKKSKMKIKNYVKLAWLLLAIFAMNSGMSEALNDCTGRTNCNHNYQTDLYYEATSENSADVMPGFIYYNYLNKFGRLNVFIYTDAESWDSSLHLSTGDYLEYIDVQPNTLVMCATSLPVVTFVDANGNIVAQKGLAAWSQITLTWYETQWLIMPNKNIVLSLPEVCSDWYEKNARWECVARNGWYKWDSNLLDRVCWNGESIFEEREISVYKNGNLMLNVKSGNVAYNNDMNTCGEWFHIFTYEDLKTMFDIDEGRHTMFGNVNYDIECLKIMVGEPCICSNEDCLNCNNYNGFPYLPTSENSMWTIWYIYDENQKQFWQWNIGIETDPDSWDSIIVHSMWNTTSTIQTEDQVLCASYYPIATFLNEQWEIIAQKPIPAWTTIGLTWYSIVWWVTTMPAHNTEFVIWWCANGYHEENDECVRTKYTVTFETNWWSSIEDLEIWEWDKLNQSELATTRDWFTFGWWYVDSSLTTPYNFNNGVDGNITLYAKWNEISQESQPWTNYSGWWGVWKRISKTDTTKDTHASAEDKNIIQNDIKESSEKNETKMDSSAKPQNDMDMESYDPTYSTEQNQAYQFAKSKWITTQSNIQNANIDWKLTRIHMAKMLSNYAINVLWQSPDISKWTVRFADVSSKLDKQYDNWVTLAYQLWIMWINMQDNKFRPNAYVTRAEFATALSRMIYGIEDGKWKIKYYVPHMAKLYNEWIITNTNSSMKEKRWYVMLMLMRSAQ